MLVRLIWKGEQQHVVIEGLEGFVAVNLGTRND
jgi:hypothetical protein